jgi:hypothetical protein
MRLKCSRLHFVFSDEQNKRFLYQVKRLIVEEEKRDSVSLSFYRCGPFAVLSLLVAILLLLGVLKSHSLLQGPGYYCKCHHWFLNLNRHLDCRCLQLHLCSRARHHQHRLRGGYHHRSPHFILFFTFSILRKREQKKITAKKLKLGIVYQ